MPLPLYQVDAFTDRPFAGNPAAVCLLDAPRDDAWLQHVAAEMNLSETAFLRKTGARFELRWFTPKVEVDLCGHATLASAHVLFSTDAVAGDVIEFETRSGVLTASLRGEWLELDFPSSSPEEATPPEGLLAALGVTPVFVGRSRFDWMVEVATPQEVRDARPDFRALAGVETRGVMLTARSEEASCDFVSRFFAPAAGIDEDPVTGSAHCCLGPYWSARLGKALVVGRQISARGGVVHVEPKGDRVLLRGQAVLVMQGSLLPTS